MSEHDASPGPSIEGQGREVPSATSPASHSTGGGYVAAPGSAHQGTTPGTIVCSYCHREHSAKMKRCPFCGGAVERRVTSALPRCPRCGHPLSQEIYRDSEVDVCPRCHGVWLDLHEFDFHTSERDTFSDPSIPRVYRRPPLPVERGYIPCPRCGSLMTRQHFRDISGVLIDLCHDHGVWLDAGELEQIRCFVASGGLSNSQDRLIRRNSEQLAHVARQCDDLGQQVRMLHRFDMKRVLWQGIF